MSIEDRGDATTFEHDPEAKRKIVNRLKRAQGQLAAVIGAVESDAHCRDVVQQLAAVSKALDRAGFLVISSSLKECLANPDSEGAPGPDELEKLFLSLA
ncbi:MULTISPECIES: metal-sensitive transcriptional regulator [unclassified Leucobacter]|uniref:metal-sensitive transcriptional regulator n=1 Tax=unclassified Leucobacter TaxID=2621730 RepID=UPI00165E6A5F|nr:MULTISPECIES: metal-sensitive transcriptional regulator [unclassified Leucobacter]MBC9928709.1 metal-sensitive transcriptional regulator [Leucobacter sp. cx-169]